MASYRWWPTFNSLVPGRFERTWINKTQRIVTGVHRKLVTNKVWAKYLVYDYDFSPWTMVLITCVLLCFQASTAYLCSHRAIIYTDGLKKTQSFRCTLGLYFHINQAWVFEIHHQSSQESTYYTVIITSARDPSSLLWLTDFEHCIIRDNLFIEDI